MLTLRPLAQVKDFKPTVAKLFQPLAAALLALPAAAAPTGGHEPDGSTVEAGREAALLAALLEVYEWPDRHAGGISSRAPAYQKAAGKAHLVLQPMVHLSALAAAHLHPELALQACTASARRWRRWRLEYWAASTSRWEPGCAQLYPMSKAAVIATGTKWRGHEVARLLAARRCSCPAAVRAPMSAVLMSSTTHSPLPLHPLQHYCLATNVIGSEARGTMKRAVAALKAGYEVPIFPLLDRCK